MTGTGYVVLMMSFLRWLLRLPGVILSLMLLWGLTVVVTLIGQLDRESFLRRFVDGETRDCMAGQPLEHVLWNARLYRWLMPWWIGLPSAREMAERVAHRVRWAGQLR